MKNKKILVLGSSGFLGSHLVKSLAKKNKVVQFDTEPPSSTHPNSTFIQGSILNIELVQKAMENVDIVYHFAAVTDLDIVNNNPAQAIEVNIAGTTNVLDACIQENVERFFSPAVFMSTVNLAVFINQQNKLVNCSSMITIKCMALTIPYSN